uniref:Vacuolar protein sorting-associated protein VTA1 n=1 Tax=Dracunculus medinensis TaxID=318479 RepID=A0A158Q3X6_DRAME
LEMSSSTVPASLHQIGHYVKIANENEKRDPVIYYWCLYYAVKKGMSIDKSSPEALNYLTGLLSVLEMRYSNFEAIAQDIVAQSHIENFALKLFDSADEMDRKSMFSTNVVKLFYVAGHLIDVLTLFGELDESLISTRKYAKWKATYIYNCLKNGEVPHAGPVDMRGYSESDLFIINASQQIPSAVATKDLTTTPRHSSICAEFVSDPQSNLNQSENNNVPTTEHSALSTQDYIEAQKHAKYAVSALTYEDPKTAIENMKAAIAILTKYDRPF